MRIHTCLLACTHCQARACSVHTCSARACLARAQAEPRGPADPQVHQGLGGRAQQRGALGHSVRQRHHAQVRGRVRAAARPPGCPALPACLPACLHACVHARPPRHAAVGAPARAARLRVRHMGATWALARVHTTPCFCSRGCVHACRCLPAPMWRARPRLWPAAAPCGGRAQGTQQAQCARPCARPRGLPQLATVAAAS